jgi:hypothetical protein
MTSRFRRNLNVFLWTGVISFLIFFTMASLQWYRINSSAIETILYPVVKEYQFRDWQRDPQGSWSAMVFVDKVRPECIYVAHQIETVVGITPDGETVESTISYMGDKSPGSNRPIGLQRLDQRVRIDNPAFVKGTKFWGSVLHNCHEGLPTVTEYGPFTVGVDSKE